MKKIVYLLLFNISYTAVAQAELPKKMAQEHHDIISPTEKNRVDNKIGTALISDDKKVGSSKNKTVKNTEKKVYKKRNRKTKKNVIL